MSLTEFRADLHCHSTFSDGDLSPEELLQRAKEIGLQGLSITDHDTIAAYTPQLFEFSQKIGLKLLCGVEISSSFKGSGVHILGYGFDLQSLSFRFFLDDIADNRVKRNIHIFERLQKKGLSFTKEEIDRFTKKEDRIMGRLHIAKLLLEKKYVNSINAAFQNYLSDKFIDYSEQYEPEIVIKEIKKAKGKAVLAHPNYYKSDNFVRELLNFSFDGIEGYSAKLLPQIEEKWIKEGERRGLIITGGSDFHGELQAHFKLGSSWVREEVFKKLQNE